MMVMGDVFVAPIKNYNKAVFDVWTEKNIEFWKYSNDGILSSVLKRDFFFKFECENVKAIQ